MTTLESAPLSLMSTPSPRVLPGSPYPLGAVWDGKRLSLIGPSHSADAIYVLERPGEVLQYNGRDIVLPDIRLIWWAGGNPFHHHQDLPRLQRACDRRRPNHPARPRAAHASAARPA